MQSIWLCGARGRHLAAARLRSRDSRAPIHDGRVDRGKDGYHDDERLGASGCVRPMASVTVDASSRRAFTFGLSDSSPKTTATARRIATISGHLCTDAARVGRGRGRQNDRVRGRGARVGADVRADRRVDEPERRLGQRVPSLRDILRDLGQRRAGRGLGRRRRCRGGGLDPVAAAPARDRPGRLDALDLEHV